ncbi:hypothetical protein [Geomonas subterranea]|uniref:Uncharacterized protein n=1 Tax=Geomonas subterranea TaxID=2847989 RepID=A0ABX8LAL5_9BACT|nr:MULTISPECIES: hypothetical protein [Geomonas]QXE89017.1 hypothetical protein KP001_11105 [Geomonas subterranea]QXM08864.1 hypothetical protein KP002_18170 [Geomonas subterranea]
MILIAKPTPHRRENRPQKQALLDRSATVIPRHDLRMPQLPRQVRLFMGEGLFSPQDAPLL